MSLIAHREFGSDPMVANVTVVIPSNHDHKDLKKLFSTLAAQSILPREVIIIDSSRDRGVCPELIQNFCAEGGIFLIYIGREKCLPGEARNLGLESATGEWIAFLDIRTHPVSNWLERQLNFISENGLSGSWGQSIFEAESQFLISVRDGIYGRLPVRHLPGSVVHKDLVRRVGHFIPSIRAGEDGDWMERVSLLGETVNAPPFVTSGYKGLLGMTAKELILKWFLYYGSTRSMPFHLPRKVFLWWIFYSVFVVLAFNWNGFFAAWDVDSPLYISNVTKLSASVPVLGYLIFRGLYLPKRRGVPFSALLPTRFVRIGFVCLVLDLVKSYALLVPRFRL
jgi:glycosyltransferase involved in cell wall biosynthesis